VKTWKFKVIEYWMGGVKPERIIEVKGRTQKAAFKKLKDIQGNRDWDIEVAK
jgi:hypothetical protein